MRWLKTAFIIVLVLALGFWFFSVYLPRGEQSEKAIQKCETQQNEYVIFIQALNEGNFYLCDKLTTELYRKQCDAYHIKDPNICDGLTSCIAIATRNASMCFDPTCKAIITRDTSVCAELSEGLRPSCEIVATRNMENFIYDKKDCKRYISKNPTLS